MYSAYKFNKQGNSIQPWHTPFPIWNQSVFPWPILLLLDLVLFVLSPCEEKLSWGFLSLWGMTVFFSLALTLGSHSETSLCSYKGPWRRVRQKPPQWQWQHLFFLSRQLHRHPEGQDKCWFVIQNSHSNCWRSVTISPCLGGCPGCLTFGLSVQLSCSVMSDSLWPHGLQHTRLPCPSTTPGACSNSCPSSRWCHPTTSSSVVPFSSHLQSFPALGSFPMHQFFTSGGQTIGVSASTLVLPMNIQDWFPLGLTGWISLQFKGFSGVFSNATFESINSLAIRFLYGPTLTSTHDYWKRQ